MSKVQDARESARKGELARQGSELTGFALGTVGYGALEKKLPKEIAGIPFEAAAGGLALLYSIRKKRTKQGAMARGLGFGMLAGYLTNLGRGLGFKIGG